MLPGKSCTRFWVPGGPQGSQEGVPGLPGGNTPAVRPFGLQGESPLVVGPHMGPIRDYAVITTHNSVHAAREILHSMLW